MPDWVERTYYAMCLKSLLGSPPCPGQIHFMDAHQWLITFSLGNCFHRYLLSGDSMSSYAVGRSYFARRCPTKVIRLLEASLLIASCLNIIAYILWIQVGAGCLQNLNYVKGWLQIECISTFIKDKRK